MSEQKKIAGILVPLFSVRTARSAGIGDIGDLPDLARFALEAGQKLVQLLPIGELPEGETSPYSSATSFAIDPMYVAIDRLEDVREDDRLALFGPDGEEGFARMCEAKEVDYGAVRAFKRRILFAAFDRFYVNEWVRDSARAQSLRRFMEAERGWLADYALFRSLKRRFGESWWLAWPEGVRDRNPEVLAEHARELEHGILRKSYIQWIAHGQWAEARRTVNALGVELMGDLPFMVGVDSADVWAHRSDFATDASLGVPGDPWIPEGQDWGLPAYDWEAMDRNGLEWVRRRSNAMGRLFDRFRVDHLVGYYRMYVRPKSKEAPRWVPAEEPQQIARGEKVLAAIVESAKSVGARVIAEDLGTIPPFVTASLAKLKLPGYRVLMWEKDGEVFRDPATWPYVSLGTAGTHDTITLATWWESLRYDERRHALTDIPSMKLVAHDREVDRLTPAVHDRLLDALYCAGSELVLLSIQDIFGSKDRVNVPGVTLPNNWRYRLPDTLENLRKQPEVVQRLHVARDLVKKHRP